jgi:hypothetical protein
MAKTNRGKGIIAGILALVALIPVDFLAWWRWDVTTGGNSWTNWFDAYNQFNLKLSFSLPYAVSNFDTLYLYAGFAVIGGGALLLIGGLVRNKFLTMIGALAALAGPLIFLVAHYGNSSITAFIGQMVFFGYEANASYTWTWYLGAGFFLPIAGAILGLASMKSKE